nr:DegT/DnrJ/EryC1/StrS family aminotransferase [uncultured Blautia sp.]
MKKLNVLFSPPDITEEEIAEVVDTLKSGWITTGPKTKLFEKQLAEFCHTSKAVCLNSATACLEMALRVLGIGPGDEVITTAYTYTASASVVCHVGAKLVLIDTQKDSYEMDYEKLEQAITENTKAIISVDLAGIIGNYEKLFSIAERKKALFHPANKIQERMGRIAVLADAAHALGAEKDGKRCGEIADFTSFSFHAVKNLTTAEGGALVWRDIEGIDNEALYKQFMLFSLHGQSKDALAKTQLGAWEYDIVEPYFKCNMTDIMASLGLAQLRRYPGLLARRKEIIGKYNEALKDENVTVLNHYGENHTSSGHLYLVRLNGKTREECNEIITKMAERGVATNVHYKPLPMLSAYKNQGFSIEDYPNAYDLFANEITLPLHTKLTDEEVEYVMECFKECIKECIEK